MLHLSCDEIPCQTVEAIRSKKQLEKTKTKIGAHKNNRSPQ